MRVSDCLIVNTIKLLGTHRAIKSLAVPLQPEMREGKRSLSDQAENRFQKNHPHSMVQKALLTKVICNKQRRKMMYCATYRKPLRASGWADICYSCVGEKPRGVFLQFGTTVECYNVKYEEQNTAGCPGMGKGNPKDCPSFC